MKRMILIFAIILVSETIFAQSGAAPLSKGENQVNFGLGLNSDSYIPYFGADYAFHNDWTTGLSILFVIDEKVSLDPVDRVDYSLHALGRVDYHWNRLIGIPSYWDFYLGASVGFGFISDDSFVIALGLQLGGRLYINDKWGVNVEFGGGGGSIASMGVSMKLGTKQSGKHTLGLIH